MENRDYTNREMDNRETNREMENRDKTNREQLLRSVYERGKNYFFLCNSIRTNSSIPLVCAPKTFGLFLGKSRNWFLDRDVF